MAVIKLRPSLLGLNGFTTPIRIRFNGGGFGDNGHVHQYARRRFGRRYGNGNVVGRRGTPVIGGRQTENGLANH